MKTTDMLVTDSYHQPVLQSGPNDIISLKDEIEALFKLIELSRELSAKVIIINTPPAVPDIWVQPAVIKASILPPGAKAQSGVSSASGYGALVQRPHWRR